ncbi:Transposase DDE domain protein [Tepidimonas sediminis]|uniref:Transposase DDE domain protein n=1 Tax=Tepidimonas sediminis TaxID=2588941 RepID=A0A554WSG4_9BURK|nr:IS5 family transposase [Tepidimonas sediminis]TSE26517.1 Transposase DDE domain protein [Tepidimonas sediminis]
MKQASLGAGFELKVKTTRKREFLRQMQQVVPGRRLEALIAPHMPSPGPKGGRPPYPVSVLLRIHFLQQWFALSDPAAEEALYDVPAFAEFVGLDLGVDTVPDETTILRFRHLLEEKNLSERMLGLVNGILTERGLMVRSGTVVDATLMAAPSSTKNQTRSRDPEMASGDESEPRTTKKGNQWSFGCKAHVGTDAASGLAHSVVVTPANVADVTQAHALLHGKEQDVFADAGYQGVDKREEVQARHPKVNWHVAMRPGKRRQLDPTRPLGAVLDELESVKARIRARGEHIFGVLKCVFRYTKVRYKGLKKNAAQITTLLMLANLWLARRRLMQPCVG